MTVTPSYRFVRRRVLPVPETVRPQRQRASRSRHRARRQRRYAYRGDHDLPLTGSFDAFKVSSQRLRH